MPFLTLPLVLLPHLFEQSAPAAPAPPPKYDATSINFGVGAILPSGVPWKALTQEQRRKLFINDAFFNPRSIATNFIWAGIDLSKPEPPDWRQGVPGYGMRLASRYGRSFIGNAIQHGGAWALRTDVRYIRSKSRNPFVRVGNAVFWQLFAMHESGRPVVDVAGISAIYLQEIIGAQWVPNRTVTGYALQSANQQMVQGVFSNLFREFLPDLKRVFRRGGGAPPPVPPPPPISGPPPQSTPPASGGVRDR